MLPDILSAKITILLFSGCIFCQWLNFILSVFIFKVHLLLTAVTWLFLFWSTPTISAFLLRFLFHNCLMQLLWFDLGQSIFKSLWTFASCFVIHYFLNYIALLSYNLLGYCFSGCSKYCPLTGKDPDVGEECRQKENGLPENQMVGRHYWLNGHEFEQTPGDSGRQRNLACYSLWGCKELDAM